MVQKPMEAISKKKHVRETAFSFLEKENNTKEKTKAIKFQGLQMREYLKENRSSSLSRVTFAVRSKTLDIKSWNPWKYNDDICVGYQTSPETMSNFMCCDTYSSDTKEEDWEKILMFENHIAKQYEVAHNIKKRLEMRETVNNEDGLASVDFLAPTLQLPL